MKLHQHSDSEAHQFTSHEILT